MKYSKAATSNELSTKELTMKFAKDVFGTGLTCWKITPFPALSGGIMLSNDIGQILVFADLMRAKTVRVSVIDPSGIVKGEETYKLTADGLWTRTDNR
ncbi:MAG: hypothetical protein LBT59_04410 [Clostridiales bacterium]|jgi:hypothetical protein|nr:hypothetical protein [Clostridiales bacterium]